MRTNNRQSRPIVTRLVENNPGWTPSDVNPAAWFDSADSKSVIRGNPNSVSGWIDKSGNGKHASQSSPEMRPIFQNNGLNFYQSILVSEVGITKYVYSGPLNIYYIMNRNDDMINKLQDNSSNQAWPFFTERIRVGPTSVKSFINGFFNNVLNSYLIASNGIDLSANIFTDISTGSQMTNSIVSQSHLPGKTDTIFTNGIPGVAYGNTNDPASVSSAISTAITGVDKFSIGNRLDIASLYVSPINGLIKEIIITTTLDDQTTRERIEGYLAWKWNLQNKLSSRHPYKNKPPSKF